MPALKDIYHLVMHEWHGYSGIAKLCEVIIRAEEITKYNYTWINSFVNFYSDVLSYFNNCYWNIP